MLGTKGEPGWTLCRPPRPLNGVTDALYGRRLSLKTVSKPRMGRLLRAITSRRDWLTTKAATTVFRRVRNEVFSETFPSLSEVWHRLISLSDSPKRTEKGGPVRDRPKNDGNCACGSLPPFNYNFFCFLIFFFLPYLWTFPIRFGFTRSGLALARLVLKPVLWGPRQASPLRGRLVVAGPRGCRAMPPPPPDP